VIKNENVAFKTEGAMKGLRKRIKLALVSFHSPVPGIPRGPCIKIFALSCTPETPCRAIGPGVAIAPLNGPRVIEFRLDVFETPVEIATVIEFTAPGALVCWLMKALTVWSLTASGS